MANLNKRGEGSVQFGDTCYTQAMLQGGEGRPAAFPPLKLKGEWPEQ